MKEDAGLGDKGSEVSEDWEVGDGDGDGGGIQNGRAGGPGKGVRARMQI